MLRDYQDIIGRLGPPLWWDGNGCPRYVAFHPDQCGVYNRFVALLEISCQGCDQHFRVTTEVSSAGREAASQHLPTPDNLAWWHYGDPPPHGCLGDTMNSEPERIIEFWAYRPADGWWRLAEYEVASTVTLADQMVAGDLAAQDSQGGSN